MPIYEYRCEQCGRISEFLEGIGKRDNEKRICKNCGSKNLHKIFSTSYVNSGNSFVGGQNGKTCCGREERCDTPPCSESGECER